MGKKVLFWVFLIAGIYLIVVLARDLWQILSAKKHVEGAEKRVEQLAQKQDYLNEQLKWVQTDEFVEKEAREKLMLSKPGERVVLLPKLGSDSGTFHKDTEEVVEVKPPWKHWAQLFGFF